MAERPTDSIKSKEQIVALSGQHPIVFFDGVCGLCNTVVDWLMQNDPHGRLRFAPLQGSTAALALESTDRTDLNTVVVLKNGRVFRRSRAVVEALKELPAPWSWAAHALWLAPSFLRDVGYNSVAKVRYRIWGQRESCRLPSLEERSRFLD